MSKRMQLWQVLSIAEREGEVGLDEGWRGVVLRMSEDEAFFHLTIWEYLLGYSDKI